eukprot:Rhum_TRINITY_DN14765_c0_g2::Rhum_TRINITY_DN14765_c0_g2_i1::g.114325::m.114325
MSGPRHLFLALRSGVGHSVRWSSGGSKPPLRSPPPPPPPSDDVAAAAAAADATSAGAAAADGVVRGETRQQEKPRRRIPLREYVKSPTPTPGGDGGEKPAAAAADAAAAAADADAAQAPMTPEGGRTVAPAAGRKRMVAVYGEQGVQEDVVARLDAQVDKLREDIIMTDAKREEGSVVEVATGSGPKPVWSFADAGPKGWWPLGESTIGVPPDAYGRVAKRGTLKQSPSGIKKRGLSSTVRTRELRDVWLTRMPITRRLLVAVGRRLSPQEIDQLGGLRKVLIVLAILVWGSLIMKLYEMYCANKFLNAKHTDHKLTKICSDIKMCMDLRGEEYLEWIRELQKTAPTPPDQASEAEMIWRELIKKGWVRIHDDDLWMIAEPFRMNFIPSPGHADQGRVRRGAALSSGGA